MYINFNMIMMMTKIFVLSPCLAITVARIKTRDEKWTPLHFAARYRPRYKDDDDEEEEGEEGKVTYLSSSKQAVQYLINKCRVDVSLCV